MDPNTTLLRIRQLVTKVTGEEEEYSEDAFELAELTASLDEWLTGGGFLPNGWAR